MIHRAVAEAKARQVPSVLVTFDPHPVAVLRPDRQPLQLTTVARRTELAKELGIDSVYVLRFSPEMQHESPQEFVDFLVAELGPQLVVVGENFSFGYKAAGKVSTLAELGAAHGFEVVGLPLTPEDCSSTTIRGLIADGNVAAAAELLGHPTRVEGVVVHGDARGRELGFPTANLRVPPFTAIPADGVYACWFRHSGPKGANAKPFKAAVSIGTNPTFGPHARSVEAYVLDVDQDFYDQAVTLDFVVALRGQITFSSIGDLIAQITEDVKRTRSALD